MNNFLALLAQRKRLGMLAILWGLVMLLTSTLSFGRAQSLLEIYDLAKANDHQFQSQYAQYKSDSESAAINRASLRPQIRGTVTGSYSHSDTRGSTSQETDADSISYGMALEQSIINNSVFNTYKQGKVESKAARATFQANKLSLMVRSAQAYFNVLRAEDQLDTAKAEEKAQAALLEKTRQRYDVGLISINDVYQTQAAHDSAVAATISAEVSVGTQYDSLTVLTGKLHDAIVPLQTNFTATALTPSSKQDWVDIALKNNYTLKASELTAQSTDLRARAAKSNHLPTLSGSLNYTGSHSNSDIEGSGSTQSDTNTTSISLNLSIPLYSGGSLSALERQAAQNAIRSREEYLLTQRQTIQNTRSLYLTVTSDIAQIKARQQAILSNESALESIQAGYSAGTRDIVDVVNAQRNLFQAQRDYFDSLYNYIINTLLLKEAAGTLLLSDLEALEASLLKSQ